MGIDFRVSSVEVPADKLPGWPSGMFHEFRCELAALIGIPLDSMRGFGGLKSWDAFKDEPLVPFLNHSDCDGRLLPRECAKVVPRLREFLSKVEDGDSRGQGEMLADLMDIAVKEDRPLEFC